MKTSFSITLTLFNAVAQAIAHPKFRNGLLLLVVLGLCWNATALSQDANKAEQKKVDDPGCLLDILDENGVKLNCYFTVEFRGYGITGKDSKAEVMGYSVRANLNADSLPALLSKLRAYLGNGFVVEQDSKDSKIVRIIEKVLAEDKNYIFNKKINFKYKGSISPTETGVRDPETQVVTLSGGLLETVAKKGGGDIITVLAANNGATIWGYFGDRTQINVDVTNETVRSILTDFLPKSKYHRVLWRAITDTPVKNGKQRVSVAFFGPTMP